MTVVERNLVALDLVWAAALLRSIHRRPLTTRRWLACAILLMGFTLADPASAGAPRVFNVRDFGAVGDGRTLDTTALNAAIEKCAAEGGGQVRVSPGDYLTATVRLRSNVTLVLDDGACLIGCSDPEQYQDFEPPNSADNASFRRWHRALLLGVDVENVTITGRGTINGNKVFDARGEEHMRGPHAILLANSRNVALRDFAIRDAANYAVMLVCTSQVNVHNLTITGGWDGVHFRGRKDHPCREVSITDCQFYTGDDCIAGWYWEDTLISRCIINSSCNGVRLIGPAKNLIVHDCLFFGPGRHEHRTSGEKKRKNMLAGLCLQPGAWERADGPLDDVKISSVTMHDVTTPLHLAIRPGNMAGRITIDRLTASGVYRAAASIESWAESPFGKVTLRDWSVSFSGGGTKQQAAMVVQAPGVDARPLPAWGLYARNVSNLTLENVRLTLDAPDARPPLIAQDVRSLSLDGLRLPEQVDQPPVVLQNVARVAVRDAGMNVVPFECTDLVVKREPFSVTALVQGGTSAGLAKLELTVDQRSITRWVWLNSGEKKEVVFADIQPPGPGRHQIQCGVAKREWPAGD